MDRRWLMALMVACAVCLAGCGDDGGDGDNTAGTNGGDGDGDGDGNTCERPNPQGSAASYISGLCGDCLCRECSNLIPQCNDDCFNLIACMHTMCDGNVGDLDACAADACSEFAAGLTGAKAIASCLYDPADKDRMSSERQSCYISCNFGVR